MPIRITGLVSGLDTEALVSELVSAYSTKKDNYVKAQTKLSWKQDAWKSMNSKIYSLYSNISSLRYSSAYSLKNTSVSDSTKATVTASSSAVNGTQTLEVNQLATAGYLTGATLATTDGSSASTSTTLADLGYSGDDTTITVNGTDITVGESTTINEVVNSLKNAGVNASFDETNQRIFVSAKDSGEDNDFTLTGDSAALSALGLVADDGSGSADAVRVIGKDAEITLNGATFTNSSNTFSINGLTITALAETTSAISITTATDSQGIYDKIKDFLTQYNEVINEMTSKYNADSAKGYEPLTDDEKSSMTDSQIEAWEDKIKDALLRRDSTLSTVMNTMITAMSASQVIGTLSSGDTISFTKNSDGTYAGGDGKTYTVQSSSNGSYVFLADDGTTTVSASSYSWANFGISTLGYLNSAENEQNAYHIDGDEDDSATSSNTDKLMAAITSDPDTVLTFMKAAVSQLYSDLGNRMTSTSLRSAYTVYNDKEMAKEYSDYTTTISKWEEKVADLEDYYYKKFAAMESALSTLQSQTSSLTSLF